MALSMKVLTGCIPWSAVHQLRHAASLQKLRSYCADSSTNSSSFKPFDESLLEILVCPLSKQPLRYDKATNELVSDSIGVAYPIRNGIPNLVPQDGRVIDQSKNSKT